MAPADQAAGPMQFSPPVCCQLSQAGTSSLLRIHLPPHTASVGLEFPLVPAWKPSLCGRSGARLPQLRRVSCERPHPQSHRRSDQVWGFTIFGTLTHLQCRIWFAFALEAVHFLLLPSDPAVTSNALAIWIVFPPVGVTPASSSRPDGLATLGKPKGTPFRGSLLRFFYRGD
jgi:hypothetical protein